MSLVYISSSQIFTDLRVRLLETDCSCCFSCSIHVFPIIVPQTKALSLSNVKDQLCYVLHIYSRHRFIFSKNTAENSNSLDPVVNILLFLYTARLILLFLHSSICLIKHYTSLMSLTGWLFHVIFQSKLLFEPWFCPL